jgi:hypothetical protein
VCHERGLLCGASPENCDVGRINGSKRAQCGGSVEIFSGFKNSNIYWILEKNGRPLSTSGTLVVERPQSQTAQGCPLAIYYV